MSKIHYEKKFFPPSFKESELARTFRAIEEEFSRIAKVINVNIGAQVVFLKIMPEDTTVEQGDDKMRFTVPIEFHGMNLVSVGAHVYTVDGGANDIVIDIYNYTDSSNMLSTPITIDAGEKDSKDSVAPAVIDSGEDDVVEGDEIGVDVTTYAGDTAKGLEIRLGFRTP